MEARISVVRASFLIGLVALAGLAGCNSSGGDNEISGNEAVTVDVPKAVTAAEGITPMAERVAVLGILNKRNGIVRDVTLKPGQAIRVKDVVVRLRACEMTAPWEAEQLTGAFVQVDIRQPNGQWNRRFSGWLYKESPSLNVVEDPVYDVWPKSCTMTWPGGKEAAPSALDSSSRSSASKSGAAKRADAPDAPADPGAEVETVAPVPDTPPADSAPVSNRV